MACSWDRLVSITNKQYFTSVILFVSPMPGVEIVSEPDSIIATGRAPAVRRIGRTDGATNQFAAFCRGADTVVTGGRAVARRRDGRRVIEVPRQQ